MKNIIWKVKHTKTIQNLEQIKDALLSLRNFESTNTKKISDIIKDPQSINFNKKDLTNSYEILKNALDTNSKIIIHGDYDVDGITSTAILYENLLKIGFGNAQIQTFLPNRFKHGYGFSYKSFTEIANTYPSTEYGVIILTDCGITANKVIRLAKKQGYKIILIDHHTLKKTIPKANAVFWNTALTASVLAYFFSKYMEIKFLGKSNLNFSVDLASLGFICDLGDLSNSIGNTITKIGLEQINVNTRAGLKELFTACNIAYTKQIKSYDLGWVIGPRLNASGRLEDATDSLNLIMGIGANLNLLARNLNEINIVRQATLKKMYEEAVFGLSNKKYIGGDLHDKVIVVDSENFHEGVIGLVSSRLTKEYYKPAITICWQNNIGKGSVRSIEGVDITEILSNCQKYLIEFGGHKMAAGFGIKREQFELFKKQLAKVANTHITEDILIPKIFYDLNLNVDLLTKDLLDLLDDLEPYGNGNPKPLFALKNVKLNNFNLFGKAEEHLGFKIGDSNIRAVYFGNAKILNSLNANDYYDVLFNFEKNEYKGSIYPQILVKDLRLAE